MNPSCHGGPACPMEQVPVPPLDVLVKHAPSHHRMEVIVKSPKRTKKLHKAEKLRKAAADAVKSYATDRTLRLGALERLAKSGDVGYAYMLAKEQVLQGREDDATSGPGSATSLPGVGYPRRCRASHQQPRLEDRSIPDRTIRELRCRRSTTARTCPRRCQDKRNCRVLSRSIAWRRRFATLPLREERELVGYELTRANLIRAHSSARFRRCLTRTRGSRSMRACTKQKMPHGASVNSTTWWRPTAVAKRRSTLHKRKLRIVATSWRSTPPRPSARPRSGNWKPFRRHSGLGRGDGTISATRSADCVGTSKVARSG